MASSATRSETFVEIDFAVYVGERDRATVLRQIDEGIVPRVHREAPLAVTLTPEVIDAAHMTKSGSMGRA